MSSPTATILVVDDNAATRYSTSRVLRAAGFDVREAATGLDALTQAATHPDLVILDVDLPDIDGFEVCRQIRQSPVTARTPVLHLSAAYTRDDDKVQGLDAGADGYMTHPVEPPVLVATVNAFLRARRAEDALRASEAKFATIFERAPTGIALLSEELSYLDVNPALCRHLGQPREALLGQPIEAFLPPESVAALASARLALTATGTWAGAFAALRRDGSPVHLEWTLSRHPVDDTCLAITTDVSERLEIEAEREQLLGSERAARAEAERANRLKDEFLAVLSHELRTPLNAVVGWAHVLRRHAADAGPDITRAADAIERNARVQSHLIADLLDVSRITSGKLLLDVQQVDPVAIVEAAVGSLASTANDKRVGVVLQGGERLGMVRWDPARLTQVVWNLVDNAIKFSPAGATVDVSLRAAGEAVELSVTDHGRGIETEFLPHIFERFRQQDSSTTRSHGGLGLGLAVVKQLVDAHGDEVVASSAGPGHGSTFTVRMRRASDAEAPPAPAQSKSDVLAGARVLVVEDDPDARELVVRLLRDASAEVQDVSTVQAALGLLDTFRPHLLVSDIGMQGEDGYDLIRKVRALGYSERSLPAIALTAFAGQNDRDRALAAGYQQHLVKPVHPTRLLPVASALIAAADS